MYVCILDAKTAIAEHGPGGHRAHKLSGKRVRAKRLPAAFLADVAGAPDGGAEGARGSNESRQRRTRHPGNKPC
jgi:hypothetical protein